MIVMFLICAYASMIISGVIIDLLMSNKVNYTSDISYANVKFIKALEKVPKKSNEINKVIGNYEKNIRRTILKYI